MLERPQHLNWLLGTESKMAWVATETVALCINYLLHWTQASRMSGLPTQRGAIGPLALTDVLLSSRQAVKLALSSWSASFALSFLQMHPTILAEPIFDETTYDSLLQSITHRMAFADDTQQP